jgi:hypothetical protein
MGIFFLIQNMFFFNSKYVFFFLEAKQKTSKNRHGESFSRRHVSVALLARAAGAPETPSEGQVLSPSVCVQKLYMHACVVMAEILDRMTRTASLSASHSSPELPAHHRKRARCCLRLFCRKNSRNCTCMRVWLMSVMLDRMTRTASLSASHSSSGLPARQRPRQRARCCLRLFCRRLSVCRNCMLAWLMPLMLDRMTRTALLLASHSSPGLPARQRPRHRARCCLRRFGPRLSMKRYMHACMDG